MWSELFYSVEDAWLISLCGCCVIVYSVYQALQSRHWLSWQGFFRDERGASYTMNYMLTFPFFLFTVCWTIQGCMILIVKIGVMHSAHMAARSAVVWRSADPYSNQAGLELAKEKASKAAMLALVPYASGLRSHEKLYQFDFGALGRSLEAIPAAIAYDRLYRQLAKNSAAQRRMPSSGFLQRKYRYAAAMTTVELGQHTNRFNEDLPVQVRFRMPIHIPGAGRLMGTLHWSRTGFYRDVTARATLPLETPETPDGRLGIEYDSSQL